jgi:HEAT repeat protein
LPLAKRVERIAVLLDGASRELIMHAAADAETPRDAADAFAAYLVDRGGGERLERDAGPHRTRRDKWRRIAALRILNRLDESLILSLSKDEQPRGSTSSPRAVGSRQIELLARAVEGEDGDVAATALSLLGTSRKPEAADILFDALKRRTHPASRVAAQLDRSPQDLAARLTPLLRDADPVVRLWAATLLGRYASDGVERELAQLADDEDSRVRKAAVQSLGQIGETLAAVTALRLLNDPVSYVRATAARAIGKLDREDLAEDIAALLGDPDWWVRFAAKECLESFGAEVWPVLARALDHSDRFVRNGAAEVFQNIGVLDSFIVMEAASDDPAPQKIAMLRRIAAAGGVRLTDSLVERAGPMLGSRLRDLLSVIGLQDVGAA